VGREATLTACLHFSAQVCVRRFKIIMAIDMEIMIAVGCCLLLVAWLLICCVLCLCCKVFRTLK